MYSTFSIRQRLVAQILLLSLFLQSCSQQTTLPITTKPIESTIDDSSFRKHREPSSSLTTQANISSSFLPISKTDKQEDLYEIAPFVPNETNLARSKDIALVNSELIDMLADKIFTAKDGHKITFGWKNNQPIAIVEGNLPGRFGRKQELPVYLTSDMTWDHVATMDELEQKYRIQVMLRREGQKPHVLIGGLGLRGGHPMWEGEQTAEDIRREEERIQAQTRFIEERRKREEARRQEEERILLEELAREEIQRRAYELRQLEIIQEEAQQRLKGLEKEREEEMRSKERERLLVEKIKKVEETRKEEKARLEEAYKREQESKEEKQRQYFEELLRKIELQREKERKLEEERQHKEECKEEARKQEAKRLEEEKRRQEEERIRIEIANSHQIEKEIAKQLEESTKKLEAMQNPHNQEKYEDKEALNKKIEEETKNKEILEELARLLPIGEEKSVEELEAQLEAEITQSIEAALDELTLPFDN